MRNMDAQDRRLPKLDIPLPSTLKGLTGPDKPNFPASFPTMSEFFESRRQVSYLLTHHHTLVSTEFTFGFDFMAQMLPKFKSDNPH